MKIIKQEKDQIEADILAIMVNEIQKEINNQILISMLDNWPYPYYSSGLPEGWAGEHKIGDAIGLELYTEVVKWIRSSVKNPTNNVYWTKIGECIHVKFRKKQDYVLYWLKYGHHSNG